MQRPQNAIGTVSLTPLSVLEHGKRILLYPAASGSAYFYDFLQTERPDLLTNIVGLADRDPNKWRLCQNGLSISPPEKIAEFAPDVIVVCSSENFEAICRDLREIHGLDMPMVLSDTIREYARWESQRSTLAQLVADRNPDDLDLTPFANFFHMLPLARDSYPVSLKGGLTFRLLDQVKIPRNLKGKTVLDLGAADGFYGFEAKARGATEVLALEDSYWSEGDGLRKLDYMGRHYGLHIEYGVFDVNELTRNDVGEYDMVFCLGLYYHLRDPFRFFRNLRKVVKEKLFLSGRTIAMPLYNPFPEQPGKAASYCMLSDTGFGKWTPNIPCLMDMLRIAGFEHVEVVFDYCPPGSCISSTALQAS